MHEMVRYLKTRGYNVPMKPLTKTNNGKIVANGTKPYIYIKNGVKKTFMVNPNTGVQLEISAIPQSNVVTFVTALGKKKNVDENDLFNDIMTTSNSNVAKHVRKDVKESVKKIAKENRHLFFTPIV